VAAAFVLAWLTYRWIETPIRRGRPKTALAPFYPALLVAVMAAVGLLGFATYQSDGFANRVSPEIAAILKAPYDIQTAYRNGRCFFNADSGGDFVFADECAGDSRHVGPLVLIWGDSHGAHLYPGLKYLQENGGDFRLAQFTGCVPLPDDRKRGRCAMISDQIRTEITRLKPELVILGARWSSVRSGLDARLKSSVDFLREQGVKEIFLVGPPPIWKPDLKTAVFYFYTRHQAVPDRMKDGLEDFQATQSMDARLRKITKDVGIRYISALDRLCNNEGCVVRVGQAPDALIAADRDHYSTKGSIYFVRSFSAELTAALEKVGHR
jgi:hypothetical protein